MSLLPSPGALLQGRRCIVTGGAGSVGLATARSFLEQGAQVLLVDAQPAALDQALQSLPADLRARAATACADVGDAAQTQAYIAQAVQAWGGLDVLVCNAGINGAIAPISDYPDEVFDAVMRVNLRGTFLALKHGLPALGAGGSVVITASVVGVTADPGICAYASSKHALIGLMRVAAKEAAPRGIRVNVVAPGPLANGFQDDIERRLSTVVGRDATQMLDQMIPLGRHGRADEVAQAMLFLASAQSSFCTGTVLMVDGGMHV